MYSGEGVHLYRYDYEKRFEGPNKMNIVKKLQHVGVNSLLNN